MLTVHFVTSEYHSEASKIEGERHGGMLLQGLPTLLGGGVAVDTANDHHGAGHSGQMCHGGLDGRGLAGINVDQH